MRERPDFAIVERGLPGEISQRQFAVGDAMQLVRQTGRGERPLQEHEGGVRVFRDENIGWPSHGPGQYASKMQTVKRNLANLQLANLLCRGPQPGSIVGYNADGFFWSGAGDE